MPNVVDGIVTGVHIVPHETKTSIKSECLKYINAVEPNIKFTVEETRPDGSLPFLDTLVMPKQDGTLETKVYRKPTHTDLYLQGTDSTPYHQNIVSSPPSSIQQKLYTPTKSHCTKKKHTWKRYYKNPNTILGQ